MTGKCPRRGRFKESLCDVWNLSAGWYNMEWKKVKTILIYVLLGVNIFLAANFLSLGFEKKAAGGKALLSVVSILSENGISVSPDMIPKEKHMVAYEGVRDDNTEAAAALSFTGSSQPERPGGGIVNYASQTGTAVFRTGGVFSAQILNSKMPESAGKAWEGLSTVLKNAGFDLSDISHVEKAENNLYSVECVQRISSFEVFNGRIKAEFSGDNTLALYGKWAPFSKLSPMPDSMKETADLLLSLRGCLSGVGISSGVVTSITDGYLITAPTTQKIRLSPVWEIRISGEIFYLDRISGIFVLAE